MGLNLANSQKDKTNGYDKLVNKLRPQEKRIALTTKKEPILYKYS
jgi:hypothetical protein